MYYYSHAIKYLSFSQLLKNEIAIIDVFYFFYFPQQANYTFIFLLSFYFSKSLIKAHDIFY
jgi:hypothetical protein